MGISTHILDTSVGRPAAGISVQLELGQDGGWTLLKRAETDADGRAKQMLPEGAVLRAGFYRLRFETARHFEANGARGLYPFVEITFEVVDASQHFHIPLLLTANGYTTYRGS